MPTNRNYISCKYITGDSGWGGTDISPGDPMTLNCYKDHWNFNDKVSNSTSHMYSDIVPSLRECLEHAITCKDYEYIEPVNTA